MSRVREYLQASALGHVTMRRIFQAVLLTPFVHMWNVSIEGGSDAHLSPGEGIHGEKVNKSKTIKHCMCGYLTTIALLPPGALLSLT